MSLSSPIAYHLTESPLRFPLRQDYTSLPTSFYSSQHPTSVANPALVHGNPDGAKLIGFNPDAFTHPDVVAALSGNALLPDCTPISQVYAGHQFGHFVPQLGDGRAILLGNVINDEEETWDIVLKGAGRTPYSRFGDGRAVLRSTIREYLCSEAMYGLGIPTTRALCLTTTGEEVARETMEPGAILTRLSPTHIRPGHFEYFQHTAKDEAAVKTLADYVLNRFHPELLEHSEPYGDWLDEVVRRTARLVAQWQAVGFAHGVMNTDNFSVLGITIDYGPYGFLDTYDPGFICNHSDHGGRYSFENQPGIALWNMHAFAQALKSLISIEAGAHIVDEAFKDTFIRNYSRLMRHKFGLMTEHEDDLHLIHSALSLMARHKADYTRFFRLLSHATLTDEGLQAPPEFLQLFCPTDEILMWLDQYEARLRAEHATDEQRRQRMLAINPKYILRNYMAEQAIRKAEDEGDYSELDRVWRCLRNPYDEQPEFDAYFAPPPEWAQSICVSCSS